MLAVFAGVAWAQTSTIPPELEQKYDAAFQQMLKQPANLDVLFAFATLATQTGDLEGAISALERMLLIDPNLPRVRLELGVLYYRMSSFEVARTYLDGALKSPALPPEVRTRAEQFIAQIESQQNPSTFSGEVFLGWRYQSNANSGPSTSSVRLFGQTANLNSSAVGSPDWGAVGSLQLRHSYDLGLQDKAALETQLTAYGSRQFQLQAANVTLLDFTSGPRFQVFRGIFEDVSLKPFGSAGYIWVNDTPYYGSFGSGLETGILLSDRLRNTSTALWRRHDHQNSTNLPTNLQYRGVEYATSTNFQYQLNQMVSIFVLGNFTRYEADLVPNQSYNLWGAGAGMSFRFADPLFKSTQLWSMNLSYTYQWWSYDAVDITVDSTTLRQQLDSTINISLAVPFDDRTTFTLIGGRLQRTASLPNYAFDNNNVMFGIGWKF